MKSPSLPEYAGRRGRNAALGRHALWREMRDALSLVGDATLAGIGVDSWGVDYALLGAQGELLENPYHYRDARNVAAMADVLDIVSRDEIYAATGIQFMPINTIYQLFAATRHACVTHRRRRALRHDPGSVQSLADRRSVLRVHRRLDNAADESANAHLGGRLDGAAESADASRCADCRSRIDHRPVRADVAPAVRWPARRSSRRPRTTRRRPSRPSRRETALRSSAPAPGRSSAPSSTRRC